MTGCMTSNSERRVSAQDRLTPEQRTLRARLAAHTRWATTEDRSAATAPARRGLDSKFERMADPDGVLDPHERAIRADHFRQAHYLRMAMLSVKARTRMKRS